MFFLKAVSNTPQYYHLKFPMRNLKYVNNTIIIIALKIWRLPLDIIYDRNPCIISRNLVIFCSAFIKKKKKVTDCPRKCYTINMNRKNITNEFEFFFTSPKSLTTFILLSLILLYSKADFDVLILTELSLKSNLYKVFQILISTREITFLL